MKRFGVMLGTLAVLALTPAIAARAVPPSAPKPPTSQPAQAQAEPDAAAARARVESIESRLHPQTGDIRLPGADAVLHLGQDYYFLPPDEARLVIVDGWGNPPDAATNVLGIVFQAGRHFYEPDAWGAVISYNSSGYVSDDDADSANYAELLQQLQAGDAEENQRRAAQGFPAQHLVGWAEQPAYNRATHSVVWAQNLQIAGQSENSLNYDVRLLGRNGVLSLNMVTGMSQLAATRQAAQRFAAQAEFTPGNRYADHQTGDRTAEYGVAGLVAAGVGVAVASKTGVIAVILLFLKKIGILIVAGIALVGGWLRRVFSRRRDALEGTQHHEAAPDAQPATPPLATDAPPPEGEAAPPQPTG
jgi:uncharacterized membrane-anchored protein